MSAEWIVVATNLILAVAAVQAVSAQRSVVRPGDARLRHARMRLRIDMIMVLAAADGHIVRILWTNADGSVVWKRPPRDVPFRN